MKKIYVASSWRNSLQPSVVLALEEVGFEVYDFRNPAPGNQGFSWRQVDIEHKPGDPVTIGRMKRMLNHPISDAGFKLDMDALIACDICVLVLPCGRSAHLELGQAVGYGKRTWVLGTTPQEPELMYKMCTGMVDSIPELLDNLLSFDSL